MDDDDIKAAAVANQSDENKKPGAVHMSGIKGRNIRHDPNDAPTSATTEDTNRIDPSNNRLIRKLRGELPCASDIDSSRQTTGAGGPFTENLSISTNAATESHRMELSDGHDNGTATGSHANRDVTVTGTMTTEATRNVPVELLVNDDHSNPLIRKLRGELPSHFNGSPTADNIAASAAMPATTDVIGTGSNSMFTKLRGDSPNYRYHQSVLATGVLSDDLENGDIAVARPADEVDETMPTAVEYDSDAKPSNKSTNRRIGLYIFLAFSTVIIGIVGAFVGTKLTSTVQDNNVPFSSTTSAYRERVAQFISNEDLDDVSNPYYKALDWISNKDPMLTTPNSPRLIQRFILAYFYFATSARQPWGSDCAPSNDTDNDSCIHKYKLHPGSDCEFTSNQAFKWLSNTDECKWAGLQCDLKSQIQEIRMGSGMEMFGTFPMGIVYLPYLQTLSLHACGLEGPLPDLREAKNLLRILLWENDFTGAIPGGWFQSRIVQDIDVQGNQISGTISTAYSQMPDLLYLTLAKNLLTGTIPTEIANSRNLQGISLERNSLQGGIPRSLGQMKYLKLFDASYTSITGTIPEQIGGMDSLADFRVSGNLLTGKIPETFWKLTNLYYIELADNSLTGTISGKISALPQLRKLNIRNNQLTGSLPARLGRTDIETLVASGNMLNGTVAPQLCDLVESGQLSVLELDCAAASNSGNEISAEIICPTDCCTICCSPDGTNCHSNF